MEHAAGDLGGAIRSEVWAAPGSTLSVDNTALQWDQVTFLKSPRWIGHGPGLLDGFLALGDAAPDRVRRYASRWGMLDLCRHKLPYGHAVGAMPASLGETRGGVVSPSGLCVSLFGREPLEVWRYWARQAKAIVELGAALRDGRRGDPRQWRALFELGSWAWSPSVLRAAEGNELPSYTALIREEILGQATSMPDLRRIITEALDTWLLLSGVHLALRWSKGRPESIWRGGGLFGALGLQMLLAISGATGWAACAGCSRQHVPARPNSHQRSFCPDCRERGVDHALASRDRRRRLRSGGGEADG